MFAAIAACGSPLDEDDLTFECSRGATRSCAHETGCRAIATCLDPERGFEGCECIPEQLPLPALGQPCSGDAACAPGAICAGTALHRLWGGVLRQGVCAADCSADSTVCSRYAKSTCVATNDGRHCLPTCSFGPSSATSKCQGRQDSVCSAGEPEPYCRPLCTSDRDCARGHCDLRNSVCVETPARAQPEFGMPCESGDAAACGALCVEVPGAFSFCSHRCSYGSSADCSPLQGVAGACLVAASGGSIGDLGYCAPLCNADVDCARFRRRCEPFDDSVLERAFGHRGACTGGVTGSIETDASAAAP